MSNDPSNPPSSTDPAVSKLQTELVALDREMQLLLEKRFALVSQLNSSGHRPVEPDAGEIVRTLQQLQSASSENTEQLSHDASSAQETIGNRIAAIVTEVVAHCRDSVKPLKVAYLGPEGTFTQAAAFKYFGHSTQTSPFTAIDDVFRAVESGECQLGVVPIENSIEGTINRTLDRITDSPLGICGEEIAAIASLNAGEIYNLPALEKNIEDDLSNTTRFIVIGSQQAQRSDNDVTTLIVSAPHKPGGLRKMLEPFDEAGISMTRIESRPAREELWSYLFFIDVAGHKDDAVLAHALQQLSDETRYMRILGSYPTVRY